MVCPLCWSPSQVTDSIAEKDAIHRRRKCKKCGYSFYTTEKLLSSSMDDFGKNKYTYAQSKKHERMSDAINSK